MRWRQTRTQTRRRRRRRETARLTVGRGTVVVPLLGQRAGAARLDAQRRGGSFWRLGYTRSQSVSFANGSRGCKIGSECFSTGLELDWAGPGWAGGEGEDEGGGEECREQRAQSAK